MGAGCLVIASNIDNNKEFIDNYEDGILIDLKNSNIKEIINAVSDEKAENIGKNSLTKINKFFKIEKIAEDYNEIYISLSK